MKHLILAIILLSLAGLSCSVLAPDCSEFADSLESIVERWDDANELASTTSRIALSGPLSQLQEIKRDTNALEVPDCATEAHKQLINYMDATIDAYLAFAADDDANLVLQLDLAKTYEANFLRELEKLYD